MLLDRQHWAAHFFQRRSVIVSLALLLLVTSLTGDILGGEWVEHRKVGSFIIRSEFPLRNEAQLIDEMESLGPEIAETLGIEIQGEATEILLFSTRRSYQEYLSHRIPEGVNRPALFVKIDDVSRVYAYRSPELATDLRHESTHALLHSSLAIMPIWLDEGLAEYFEVPAHRRSHANPHLVSLKKWNSRFTWRLNLQSLTDKQEMTEMNSRDYRDAFSVVHFLIHGPPEVQQLFRQYLTDIQKGGAPDPLEQQLSRQYRRPELAVSEHVRNW